MKGGAVAIIPVRGGSVGIPRKNARLLRGKPLLAYGIEAALRSQEIGAVVRVARRTVRRGRRSRSTK